MSDKDVVTRGPHGFKWDGLEVIGTTTANGHKILTLRTERQAVEIRITPSGLIRMTREMMLLRAEVKRLERGGRDD